MGVVSRSAVLLVDGSNSFRVSDLIAGVAIGRQTKLIRDPFAEMTRSVGF